MAGVDVTCYVLNRIIAMLLMNWTGFQKKMENNQQ